VIPDGANVHAAHTLGNNVVPEVALAVMDPRTARLDLAHDATAPRLARRFLATVLQGWGVDDDIVDRSQLLVSELVSNAVLHGTGPVELQVTETDANVGVYRVEVSNPGHGVPAMRRTSNEELSGRGLQLVDSLARNWGSNNVDGHTCVWFDVGAVLAS
jgi:anti-sigma regulatory factor (Ser/Thr protein kinase)